MSSGPLHLTVSVAMCTRNGEKFVVQQLESILEQSVPPAQIVLSDDDSSDRTVDLAVDVLAAYPDVEFVLMRNSPALGIAANFQGATQACTGDLIALSDQDDRWLPRRTEFLRDLFQRDDSLLLANSDATLVDAEGLPVGSLFAALEVTNQELERMRSGRAFEQLLRRNLVTGATTMFRRSILESAIPFPPQWVHDEWLAIVAAALGSIEMSTERLVEYRQHSRNAIGASRPSLRDKIAKLREPRGKRNDRLLAQAQELVERLRSIPHLPPDRLRKAERKLEHERVRNSLPTARMRRLLPVLREVCAGGYAAYSRGRRDILRDLVQPVGSPPLG